MQEDTKLDDAWLKGTPHHLPETTNSSCNTYIQCII